MKDICVIIPAHNEEKVIEKTITALLDIVSKDDIYLVDDGSADNTGLIAKKHLPNVLILENNKGKAGATNEIIKMFALTKNYKYIMLMDGDTVVTKSFLHHVLPIFHRDTNEEIACVVGRVRGRKHNWLTLYRIWEYEVAQTIHKYAQGITNTVLVCPGCATVYRSKVFDTLSIPVGTLAEDMDLTFHIQLNNLGKIVFEEKASVITQDPKSIKDFIKQIDRWYTGFWQCVSKHNIPWNGKLFDLEVSMLASEGLFNGILLIAMAAFVPFSFIKFPHLFYIPLFIDLFLFLLPTIIYIIVRHRHWNIIFHLPQFYLIRIICSLVFLMSFFKVALNLDSKAKWNKATRYSS